MATWNEKHDTEWTDDEREARRAPLRRLHTVVRKMQEQTRRIGDFLPAYRTPAEDALNHLLHGLGGITNLDLSSRSAKHKKISPLDFDRTLAALPALMKPWQNLQSSPAFTAAVRDKNREIRAESVRIRERNRVVRAQNAAEAEIVDAMLRAADKGDLAGALKIASESGKL